MNHRPMFMAIGGRLALAAAALAVWIAPAMGANLAEFTRCIGPQGQGPVCQLDAGTYVINSTLSVGRSNITIAGTIVTSRDDTILQRATGFRNSLIRDRAQPGTQSLTSITLRDLTVDGNRYQESALYNAYQPDVLFTATKSVLITNAGFIDSANISLGFIGPGAGGVVVNNSYFGNPAIYGIWSDVSSNRPSETANGYLLCASRNYARNILITNSWFENAGESVIAFDAKDIRIVNNLFQHNKSYTVPFNDSGGQIDMMVCSENAAIVGNTLLDGPSNPNGLWADGIEIHGRDMTIIDNHVSNNAGNGIILHGVQDAFIANWNSETGVVANNKLGGFPGIAIYNHVGWRPTDSIMIDHVNSIDGHLYGIQTFNATPQFPINHLTVTNSCLSGNRNGGLRLDGTGPDVVLANNQLAACAPD